MKLKLPGQKVRIPPESVVLADLVEEIKNQDAVSNVAIDGGLDDIKLFIETNVKRY